MKLEEVNLTRVSIQSAESSIRSAIMQIAYDADPELIIMAAEVLIGWNEVEAAHAADCDVKNFFESFENASKNFKERTKEGK